MNIKVKKILKATLPVALIMVVAWLSMLGVLYIVNGLITILPSGNTPMERTMFSIVKLATSSLVALVWLVSWFIMIVKYREKNLK